MKILDQNLQLSAQHSASQYFQQYASKEQFINGQLVERQQLSVRQQSDQFSTLQNNNLHRHAENWPRDLEQNFTPSSALTPNTPLPSTQTQANSVSEQAIKKPSLPAHLIKMIEVVEAMMEKITGQPYELKVYGYDRADKPEQSPHFKPTFSSLQPSASELHFDLHDLNDRLQRQPAQMSGQRLYLQQLYQEQETSQFQAKGSVSTADGRKLDFNLNMVMQRHFRSEQSLTLEQGLVFKDPLVVNFGGEPATLNIEKFDFDIDADGSDEHISFVAPQSGFLALDQNQDGIINDGSELFGALSGNGFSDLSAYDDDQNGWIDENDAIFAQLQIWHQNPQGLQQLSGLLELNIGAIALEHIATPFALKDPDNQQHGQIKTSGVFLFESGQLGSVQQIDLVV